MLVYNVVDSNNQTIEKSENVMCKNDEMYRVFRSCDVATHNLWLLVLVYDWLTVYLSVTDLILDQHI